jgi:hypothetical protein
MTLKAFYSNVNILIGRGFFIFITAVFLISCTPEKESNEQKYSQNGADLCNVALKVLSDINSSENNHTYMEESVQLLNDPAPEYYVLKPRAENMADMIQYFYLVNAIKNLQKVFVAYQLQLDSKISANGSNLSEKMLLACNALDSLNLSDLMLAKNKKLKTNISAGKFRIEGNLFQLTDLYAEIWQEITNQKMLRLIENGKSYENGLKKVSVAAFNPEKVKTFIEEPYSSSGVLVNLYKLKLIKDNYNRISLLQNRMNNVTEAFNLLLIIQGELMKKKQDKLKIQEYSQTLEILLTQE